ncbi:unnamed protein product, partial [Ectocarpus sp. 6 AP-2014]
MMYMMHDEEAEAGRQLSPHSSRAQLEQARSRTNQRSRTYNCLQRRREKQR